MMDWIKKYTLIEYQEKPERMQFGSRDFHLERVSAKNDPPHVMTEAGKFFTAASIWLEMDFTIDIPAFEEEIQQFVMDEIAVHFTDVKLSFEAGKAESVNLKGVRHGTAKLLETAASKSGILPVLKDIYRERGSYDPFRGGKKRNLVWYPVINSELEPFEADGTEKLKWLLNKAYFERGQAFALMPRGWHFEDNLRESEALRFFAGFVPYITLAVDADTGQVLTFEMSRNEYKRTVELNSARPAAPRRNGDVLYFDMGRALVYVIHLQGQQPIKSLRDLTKFKLYRLAEDETFAEFDHDHGELAPEGFGLLRDKDSIQLMIDTINREISKERGEDQNG